MNGCSLSTEDAVNILQKLKDGKNMKELQLCNNDIDDKATEVLISNVFLWNSLEIFKLENNCFSKNHSLLYFLLSHKIHEEVVIRFDDDDLHCANYLVNMLEHANNNSCSSTLLCFATNFKNATTLNISQKRYLRIAKQKRIKIQNRFQKHTELKQQLSKKLNGISGYFKKFIRLSELNLSGIIINYMVAYELAGAFKANLWSTLNSLSLCACGLQSQAAVELARNLKYVKGIKNIEICHNHIGNEAVEGLIMSIAHLDLLKEIRFNNNLFDGFWYHLLEFTANIHKFSDG